MLPGFWNVANDDGSEIKTLNVTFCLDKPPGVVPVIGFWFVQAHLANARDLFVSEYETPFLR